MIFFSLKLASNASLIDPQNSELQRISKLIKDRGAVEKYLSLTESYKAQGDLDMAIISLENISDLTDIEDLETRISTLEVERNEIIQNELIENLFAKLEIPDLLEASKTITKMRDVGVPEEKYSHLLEDYKQKKYDYQLAEALHAIDLAMSEDKWREAKQIVDSSQNKFSTDAVFNAKSTTVTRIHSGKPLIDSIFLQLRKAHKPRAQAYAASLIDKLNSDFELSPTLEQQAKRLQNLVTKYQSEVEITVLSDGFTFIEVKSIGQVGITISKVIKLLPGDYILVGKRDGYVSKEVRFKVQPETPLQIRVEADEQI